MQRKLNDLEKIQEVLQGAQTGLWAIELDDGKEPRMYADRTMLELLGLSGDPAPEECYQVWYHNIYEEYYPAVHKCVEKMKSENRAEVEYPWNHPVLGKIFIRCGGVCDTSYTGGICLRGYHQNITDTIRLRQEKQVLEELNGEILNSLQELFFAVYRIDFSDKTIRGLRLPEDVELKPGEKNDYDTFIQENVKRMYHPNDYPILQEEFSLKSLQRLCDSGIRKFAGEYRRRLGTDYQWVSITISFGGENGRNHWGIMALQDIHVQRQREEANRIALENACQAAKKADNAKSDFLSKMSHDIRTPLNAILGMTMLASVYQNDSEKVQDCISKIRLSGNLLMDLVNEVLDMSRIESGNYQLNFSDFRMKDLIDSMLSMVFTMFQEKHQNFQLELPDFRSDILSGDTMRIQQILINILTNANKYTPDGGTIRFRVEEQATEGKAYSNFSFSIEDTGIGMEKEFLDHIFEPFSRAEDSRISKVTGTGLGMAITYSILQLMGGTIEVESEPGKGSRFTVFLSLKQTAIPEKGKQLQTDLAEDETQDIRTLKLQGIHLLLAEDNELNLEIAKELLELSGAEVTAVKDGKEVLETYLASETGYYSVIFLDIQMPVMDGYQAAEAIRTSGRSDAEVPMVAMTANAFTEDIVRAKQAGMNEHVAKPITLTRLSEVLHKYTPKPALERHEKST